MAKDYYKILGVSKDASDDEIKKAYRKLAIKWHPDKHTNDSEEDKKKAESMFKDIAEAYEVLSNPTEREKYDNPHTEFTFNSSFNPFDLFNHMGGRGGMEDIFSSFFGGGRPKQEKNKDGKDLAISLNVTLEELYSGTLKKIRFAREEQCSECKGSGLASNGVKRTCPECGGIGYRLYTSGNFQQMSTCQTCGGKGSVIENPCSKCHGIGLEKTYRELDINIPKGASDGMEFTIKGEGSQTPTSNGKFGDLYIRIRELPHPIFERDGSDLYMAIDVPILTAITGGEHIISTVDGKQIKVKIPKLCEYNSRLRIASKGMPQFKSSKHGDLYCVVHYKMPNNLSKEESALLEELKTHENFK